jgi:phosphoglycerate dehydrogenase-like enzyme
LVEDQRRRIWRRAEVTGAMRELSGSTMVVVGLGNIGRAIARRAVGFEMRVLGIDVVPADPPPGVEAVWPVERLEEALPQADVLAIAAPFTPQTAGLIDGRRVGLLPQGALVVAISRGGILDEAALLEGLRSGRLAGAGLDVFAEEPLPADSPLWDVPNLLVSPHCSGSSWQTRERVWSITADNVRRFLAGEPLVNVCDKRAGF